MFSILLFWNYTVILRILTKLKLKSKLSTGFNIFNELLNTSYSQILGSKVQNLIKNKHICNINHLYTGQHSP